MLINITREKYRKYLWKKSQVFHDILAISKSLRHHTCDFYMRFFRAYLRFSSYLRYFVWNHTCDFIRKYASRNRKYGGPKGPLARNIASIPRLKSQVCQHYAKTKSQVCQERIASMPRANRKYSKSESQVFQEQIASMSRYVFDIFASMLPAIIASMLPDIIASMLPDMIASMLPAWYYYRKYATLYYYRYHKYTLIKSQVLQTIIWHPSLTVMSSEEVITIEE